MVLYLDTNEIFKTKKLRLFIGNIKYIQWCFPHNEKILNPIGNIYNFNPEKMSCHPCLKKE